MTSDYPMVDVVKVKPMEAFRLWVRFSDGSEGVADLSRLAARTGPMVAPLKDPTYLSQCSLKPACRPGRTATTMRLRPSTPRCARPACSKPLSQRERGRGGGTGRAGRTRMTSEPHGICARTPAETSDARRGHPLAALARLAFSRRKAWRQVPFDRYVADFYCQCGETRRRPPDCDPGGTASSTSGSSDYDDGSLRGDRKFRRARRPLHQR